MNAPLSLAPLDAVGWLAEQPLDLQSWIARSGRWRTLEPGQLLYDAGDRASGIFGLAEGSLNITFPLVDSEPVSIHRAEAGFWIGDLALLADSERLVSVRAGHRARVLGVAGSAILAHLERHPRHWPCFYDLTHRNMATALGLLSESLALSPAERVARRMLQLADGEGRVTATQEELAGLVGVTRATVRRVLDRMIAAGAVETGYGALRIKDRAAIERHARHDR